MNQQLKSDCQLYVFICVFKQEIYDSAVIILASFLSLLLLQIYPLCTQATRQIFGITVAANNA